MDQFRSDQHFFMNVVGPSLLLDSVISLLQGENISRLNILLVSIRLFVDDAILRDILTKSHTVGTAVDPKAERALAFPPRPLPAPAAVPEPAAKAPEALTSSSTPVDSPDVADLTTDEAEPSELPATAGGEGKCQHVKNAVKLPKLRKGVAHQKDWSHCLGCRLAESKAKKLAQRMDKLSLSESEGSTTGDAAGEPMPAESLWMCLSCCEINCGRTIKEHALTHHDGKKNNHPLAINLGTMDCWYVVTNWILAAEYLFCGQQVINLSFYICKGAMTATTRLCHPRTGTRLSRSARSLLKKRFRSNSPR
jgi:hypothetical protein